MNFNVFIVLLLGIAVGFVQCAGTGSQDASSGLTIEGVVENIQPNQSLYIFLDQIETRRFNPIENQAVKNGSFKFNIEPSETPVVYQVRLGNKKLFFSNEDNSKHIKLTFDALDMNQTNYEISGSPSGAVAKDMYKAFMSQMVKPNNNAQNLVKGQFPLLESYLTRNMLKASNASLPAHKKAYTALQKALPQHDMTLEYASYIKQMQSKVRQQVGNRNSGTVKVGELAPDISLPNPKGEIMTLSSLKGKVVLVDFWASWCGPCRKVGNPKLVKLYKKYDKKDFAIFNVALERGNSNVRWENAITKDGLVWPHQVVDRDRKFSPIYGASRIPRVYLIDKEGKLAAINPRGAALDAKIDELLQG